MKREIIAGILLILVFIGSLLNIKVNESMVFELESKVSDAYESAKSGDLDSARSKLDAASEHWLSLDGYTHIFIRHSEIDAITDAFFDFKSDLNDDSSTSYEGSYHRLMAHLESIRTMEQLTFGSIF